MTELDDKSRYPQRNNTCVSRETTIQIIIFSFHFQLFTFFIPLSQKLFHMKHCKVKLMLL